MDFDGPGRFGAGLFGAARWLIEGLFSVFVLFVVIALLFILVRYLLTATTAAQIYVAKNSPPKAPVVNAQPAPVVPASPVAPPATVSPAATVLPAAPAATKPRRQAQPPVVPPAP